MLQKPATAPTGKASDFRVSGGSAWKARKIKPDPSTRIRWSPAFIGDLATGARGAFGMPHMSPAERVNSSAGEGAPQDASVSAAPETLQRNAGIAGVGGTFIGAGAAIG